MTSFIRSPGVLIEPVGDMWAAFCPASGETVVLNDECAAILEILEPGPSDTSTIVNTLAADSALPAESIATLLETAWKHLSETGLIRRELRDGLQSGCERFQSLSVHSP